MEFKNKKEIKDYLKKNNCDVVDSNVTEITLSIGKSRSMTRKSIVFFDKNKNKFYRIETKNSLNYELNVLKKYSTNTILEIKVLSKVNRCFLSEKIKKYIFDNKDNKFLKSIIDEYKGAKNEYY